MVGTIVASAFIMAAFIFSVTCIERRSRCGVSSGTWAGGTATRTNCSASTAATCTLTATYTSTTAIATSTNATTFHINTTTITTHHTTTPYTAKPTLVREPDSADIGESDHHAERQQLPPQGL